MSSKKPSMVAISSERSEDRYTESFVLLVCTRGKKKISYLVVRKCIDDYTLTDGILSLRSIQRYGGEGKRNE
jgi:hypothetical protein